jgi:quercetin dioxygenase-like cupin family protein
MFGSKGWLRDAGLVGALFVVIVAGSEALARLAEGTIMRPSEIVFDGPADRLQMLALYGDPAASGLYASRVRFPAGLKVPPHVHPTETRTAVILSGTLWFAFGDAWDETKLQPLEPGAFLVEPAGVPHFAWARDGEVIAHLTAIGPTSTQMIDGSEPIE